MLSLPPDVKVVLDEAYEQRFKIPKHGVELPCTRHHKWKEPAIIQIKAPGDQIVQCPMCGRKHLLVWSKIQDSSKWAT